VTEFLMAGPPPRCLKLRLGRRPRGVNATSHVKQARLKSRGGVALFQLPDWPYDKCGRTQREMANGRYLYLPLPSRTSESQ